jgi:hypothetical protein
MTDKNVERKNRVAFRLSDDEYAEAKEKCDLGISFSELCRASLRDTKVIKLRQKNEALDKAKLSIVGRCGNNLNQLAHQINSAALRGEINDSLAAQLLQEIARMNDMMVHELAIAKDQYLNN